MSDDFKGQRFDLCDWLALGIKHDPIGNRLQSNMMRCSTDAEQQEICQVTACVLESITKCTQASGVSWGRSLIPHRLKLCMQHDRSLPTVPVLHQDLAALLLCEALCIAIRKSSQNQRADRRTCSDASGICMRSPPDIAAQMKNDDLSPLEPLMEQGDIAGPGMKVLM